MKLTVNTNHLALIDRVVETGILGKSRGDVLKGAVIEHVRFLLAGGTPFRTGPPGFVEVDTPTYGAVRDELIIQPITGKAIPVRTGECCASVRSRVGPAWTTTPITYTITKSGSIADSIARAG